MSDTLSEVVRISNSLVDAAAALLPAVDPAGATLGALALSVGAVVAWRAIGGGHGGQSMAPATPTGWAATDTGAFDAIAADAASAPCASAVLNVTTPGGGE